MTLVDTNVPLRWLLNDHPTLSRRAEAIVTAAEPGSLLLTDIVVSEITYILRAKHYSRAQIVEALQLVNRTPAYKFENEEILVATLGVYGRTSLDFADCYLLARARREGHALHTFDAALQKQYRAR